jgi:hypothetical protein
VPPSWRAEKAHTLDIRYFFQKWYTYVQYLWTVDCGCPTTLCVAWFFMLLRIDFVIVHVLVNNKMILMIISKSSRSRGVRRRVYVCVYKGKYLYVYKYLYMVLCFKKTLAILMHKQNFF